MTDEWQDIPENDGLTLGPEEALEREIAKSKALKVERLRLKDQIERLTANNRSLREENEALKNRSQHPAGGPEHSTDAAVVSPSDAPHSRNLGLPGRWAFFLLVFNLAAIGILLLFLLQKPTT